MEKGGKFVFLQGQKQLKANEGDLGIFFGKSLQKSSKLTSLHQRIISEDKKH